MSTNLFDPIFSRLQGTLDLRMKQHGLVTSNIANADTPGYKAQRVDFRAALDRLFSDDDAASSALRGGDARHIGSSASGASADTYTLDAPAWSEDGNSVKPEEEMVVLAENNLLYNATTEILNRRLGMLEYAASDGGR